jgi:hypothetical protein
MMKRLAAWGLVAATFLCSPAVAQLNYDRARQNYMDLLSGRKQPQDLSPRELYEVREFDAAARAFPRQLPETKARCRERNASSQPTTPLEDAVLDLKCSQRPDSAPPNEATGHSRVNR